MAKRFTPFNGAAITQVPSKLKLQDEMNQELWFSDCPSIERRVNGFERDRQVIDSGAYLGNPARMVRDQKEISKQESFRGASKYINQERR
ncbi:uncharacterized protein N7477_002492 [Penicillium maclennaniae]|uniref:uncharacterized protein n=1 Tax=Penicillium maclennaniae TaxID=1343394 RepID=UPI00253FA428|nr:uncharacterized protein N7477_002492 [Penicillium maclennaniae]KAJ5676859.1 hypothetical protein N7477_002492 [Penicillium maclennaniae]